MLIDNFSPITHPFIADSNPFSSFWMAGFECTVKLNACGQRVDFLQVTGHLQHLREDYDALDLFKIKTVREGIRWSQVEKRRKVYDWDVVQHMIRCGKGKGIQQIWDLCHFGYPDDLTPLHPGFTERFVNLCIAFVKLYRSIDTKGTLIVTPVNEVSFISWLGGDVRGTAPYCINNGFEVKYALMRAYIAGIAAMKKLDNNIRFLTSEPLVNMVPPIDATEDELIATHHAHEQQFQVLEMLSGRMCPELNGRPEYLDILGFNFYYNNQWVTGRSEFLPWVNDINDPRWQPLRYLLSQAYKRYNRPIVLSETSHPAEHRPNWLHFITEECTAVIESGIPLWGICWYPIIDRPDWNDLHPWHRSGFWDVSPTIHDDTRRLLYQPVADAFLQEQQTFESLAILPADSRMNSKILY